MHISVIRRISVACCLTIALAARAATPSLGIFQDHQDVGIILHPGSVEYDPAQQTYTIGGSGWDMWYAEDDFHYLWTKVSGDVSLTADIAFVEKTGVNHRKAVLMIRQSLDKGAASVDVALHADGLVALQYRESAGANLQDIESNVSAPRTLRIEKRGDYFYAFATGSDGKLQVLGASAKVSLTGPFYIGIGVCSHDKDVVKKAVFSNVKLVSLPAATGKPVLYSALETIDVASTVRSVAYVAPVHFEAPNWSRDGGFFIFNGDGKIHRLAVNGTEPATIDTGPQNRCNNDHGISPDGQSLAISDSSGSNQKSSIYIVPITRWNTATGNTVFAVLLAWMVSRRKNARLRRPARWGVRYLHHSRYRRPGNAADHSQGPGRRPGIFTGRRVHLLQLRAQWLDADMAHEGRRERPGAGALR